jgi:hypothetical protein
MPTKRARAWVDDHIVVVVYLLFAINVFLVLALTRTETNARIDGDAAVTQAQIEEANRLRKDSDVRNCIGGVDFRLEIIGLAEDILAVQIANGDAEAIATYEGVRARFAPPACVATLGLDTDGDGWPEDREPRPAGSPPPEATGPSVAPGTTTTTHSP